MAAKARPARGGRGKRRGGGLRALAASLPKVTAEACGKRGLAEGALFAEWPSIVGEELASICCPRGLSFASRKQRSDGTLTLRVETGHAVTLQHIEPLVIERINGYLGYGAVGALRLQQGPLARAAERRPPVPARLAPEQRARLAARTAKVEDGELRAALEALGAALDQAGRTRGE